VRAALAGPAPAAAAVLLAGLALAPVSARAAEPSPAPRCVPAHLNVSAALAGGQLTVSPAPQSRDASAATQISLLGVPASRLQSVSVSGSRSGAHPGRLLAYSQGDGASFLPSRPFVPGELVSVRGIHAGATGPVPFAWSFTIAVPDRAGAPGGSAQPRPRPSDYQSFHSRPDLKPPKVTVTTHLPAATAGDLFIAPYSGPGQYGPMILDENGQLVWFKALEAGARAADFRVQEYEGKPVLSWWQDPLPSGFNDQAGIVIANSAYQTIAVVRAGNGYQADLHEFQITPRGTALITVYDAIDCDLSAVGGSAEAAVADTLTQEIDLRTGLVRFEWHSLDHVPLSSAYVSDRYSSQRTPFDYFHINSVDVEQDGDELIDSRNTWAAYDVDPKTGQVRWQLGGKHSSFAMGPGTRTAFQHDARQQPDGTITFFDNGATPLIHPQSRAIELRLDMQNMSATLVRRYEHSKPLVAGSQGNLQALAQGNWMIGWGQAPYFSEVAPSGQLLFDAHLPPSYESYRAFRFPWSGAPLTAPALVSSRTASGHGLRTLYASWNGATQVASWRVLAGASQTALAPVTAALKSGFETTIALAASAPGPYLEVQALDSTGAVIGVSPVVKS